MSDIHPTENPSVASALPPAVAPDAAPRPTRSELRRAREAGDQGPVAASPSAPRGGRAQQRAATTGRASGAGRRSVLTSWWFVPLLVLIAVSVYLGVKSATPSGVKVPGVVVSSAPASP